MALDLTQAKNIVGHTEPIEMPVSELLNGSYIFNIPSYQRGYRWESSEKGDSSEEIKQVDDLLNDLTSFVSSTSKGNYYLQPLMVKPRLAENGTIEWDVLDGQQRLTTMLLILKCINENLLGSSYALYSLKYDNRPQIDFAKITYDRALAEHDYPSPGDNLDSYYIRKAKDRIERWYEEELAGQKPLLRKIEEILFDAHSSIPSPDLRAKFIWYNVEPLAPSNDRIHDIEVFNRLNRGKISLTDSELIKALFLLCMKQVSSSGSSVMNPDTFVRKWDEMGKKLQNDAFWKMISPKNKEYSNRMDLLFDFIKECDGGKSTSSYRYYYNNKKMRDLVANPNINEVENLWNDVKAKFDLLCKWHEDVHKHNYIGYLVENGTSISDIYIKLNAKTDLKKVVWGCLKINNISDIDELSYQDSQGFTKIRKILLLFNVLTCDKFGTKFPFDLYRKNSYDVEHVNSQTDNPIEKIEEKKEWIIDHALPCLEEDRDDKDSNGILTSAAQQAQNLHKEGEDLLKEFEKNNNIDKNNKFRDYRLKVENYYASGEQSVGMANKDSIGNLTLLNSTINREYKNALFPKKLRILKRGDQEGEYIPLCTKYMFLKYYSNSKNNTSAFSMMRWREEDQREYTNAIKESIKTIL